MPKHLLKLSTVAQFYLVYCVESEKPKPAVPRKTRPNLATPRQPYHGQRRAYKYQNAVKHLSSPEEVLLICTFCGRSFRKTV